MKTGLVLRALLAVAVWLPAGAAHLAAAEPRNIVMWDLSFSPDSTKIVTSGDRVRVFDVPSQKPVPDQGNRWKELEWARKIRLSPADGNLLAVAQDSGKLRLLRLGSGEVVWEFQDDPNTVHDLAFSDDGRFLALASSQLQKGKFVHGRLLIREVKTGKLRHSLDREESQIAAVAFSRTGERVAFCSGSDLEVFELSPWNALGTVRLPVGNFEGQGDPFGLSATFLKEDDRLLVAGGICLRGGGGCNPTGLLWDIDLQGEARLSEVSRPSYIRSVSAAPEGDRFVIGFHENNHQHVSLWDASHRIAWTTQQDLSEGSGEMYGLKISPDGKLVAWCDGEKLHVLKAETGESLFTIRAAD